MGSRTGRSPRPILRSSTATSAIRRKPEFDGTGRTIASHLNRTGVPRRTYHTVTDDKIGLAVRLYASRYVDSSGGAATRGA